MCLQVTSLSQALPTSVFFFGRWVFFGFLGSEDLRKFAELEELAGVEFLL